MLSAKTAQRSIYTTYLIALFFALGFAFESGQSNQRYIDRKQIEAANKSCNAINRQNESGSGASRINNPPCKPYAEAGGQETSQVTFLSVPLGEGILGIATLLLVGVTFQLVLDSRRSSERQLRAYISVELDGFRPYVGAPELVGHFLIRNSGQTPAKNLSIYSAIEWSQSGIRASFNPGVFTETKIVVQPRAKMRFGTGTRLPKADIKSPPVGHGLPEGTDTEKWGFIYVWGRVNYLDEFDAPRWTAFCHRYPFVLVGTSYSLDREHGRYHETAGNEAG